MRFFSPAMIVYTALASSALAVPISDGVDYRTYNLSDPNKVYVVEFDRHDPELDLMLGFPQGKRQFTAKEAVNTIAGRYDAPPSQDVLAAVNGSFFGSGNDITGNLTSGGNCIQLPDLSRSWPVMAFTDSGDTFINLTSSITDNQLRFADTSTLGIDIVNEDRIAETLVLYTPDWGPSTTTTAQGVEVIVDGVNYPFRTNKMMSGVVREVRTGANSLNNAIPAGGVVFSARDTKATTVQAKVQAGDRINWRVSLSTPLYNNSRMMVVGAGWILHDGAAYTSNWTNFSASFTGRNPRTVIAWNADKIFLVIVDGRSAASVGMSFAELATFCLDHLAATEAVNLDGGGSSTMVVNGTITNVPSDGSPRLVGDALMLVRRANPHADFSESDAFPESGRELPWDEKFTYNAVIPFDPVSPGGDGHVLQVMDPAGGIESARVGVRSDRDYTVEADIYCDYRPDDAASGHERYGLFAYDQGQGSFDSTFYGTGNNYLIYYRSDTGAIGAGMTVNGVVTDFLGAPITITDSGWHRMGIVCNRGTVSYFLDDAIIHSRVDTTFTHGFAGIGYHDYFSNNALIRGTRADNFLRTRANDRPDGWMLE